MIDEKLANLLGIAQKARCIVSGNFAVEQAIKNNNVKMLIVTTDAKESTVKDIEQISDNKNIPLKRALTKERLGRALGKEYRAVAAILDEGFCRSIEKMFANQSSTEEKIYVKQSQGN